MNSNLLRARIKNFLPKFLDDFSKGQLKAVGILFFIITFAAFIAMCCGKNNINVCVAVLRVKNLFISTLTFKSATNFIGQEKKVLYVPPLFFIKSLIFYAMWIYSFM